MSGNKNIVFALIFCVSTSLSLFAQSKGDFQKKYAESLDLFKSGDYAPAYEGFRLLTQANKNNPFVEYAHYYCGYSAFKVGKLLDAKFILAKSISDFPEWDQLFEVKYLLATIAFSEKNYHRGFELCSDIIFEKKIQEDVVKLIRKEVLTTSDIPAIIKEQALFPDNFTLAKALADKIKVDATSSAQRNLLQYLIQDYELSPEQYTKVLQRKSIKKSEYNVAVLLPFQIEKEMDWKKSGKELEMLEGIKLAVEKLEKEKKSKFKIYAYDTGKDSAKVRDLLLLPEMKQMDLIVGAPTSSTGSLVAAFAESNQIHYVNPLNGDPALARDYSKLFKPSYVETGYQLAQFAADSFPQRPWVAIFYNSNLRDSLIADSYKQQMEALGKKVKVFLSVKRQDISEFEKIINKFNFDSLSHIAVFNKEDLVATSFMSALEGKISKIESDRLKAALESGEKYDKTPIHVPVIAPADWMSLYIIQFKQFYRRDVHFYNTDYIDFNRKEPMEFRAQMGERMRIRPSNDYAAVGFDLMLLYGTWLHKHGNVFIEEMAKEGFVRGYNFSGVDYSNGESNAVVPILKLNEQLELIWENHR